MKYLLSLILSVMLGAAAAAPLRSQTPQAPYPYSEVELEFDSPYEAGVHLAGTLVLPPGKGPHPAVLLITGSGQQDRDETIFGHKPFLVIADYLARRGIASLRVDDRGVGLSRGALQKATTASFAGDARAALEVLRARPEIDAARVGLIGHSEGGVIAPMLAAEPANRVAFIIMLASPGVTGDLLLQRQVEDLNLASGLSPEVAQGNARFQASLNAVVLQHPEASPAELGELLVAAWRQAIPQTPAAAARQQVAVLTGAWMRYFLAFDPAPVLQQVKCPVLALNGSKDRQVRADANLPAITGALQKGGNPDVTTRILPGLNHLFQTAQTGLPAEYEAIEETFAPAALEAMGGWLAQHVRTGLR